MDKFEGTIVDRDIVLKKGKVNLNVFYFRLDGLSDKLASYNIRQDYKKLIDHLNIGDKIIVYFRKSESQKLNLDVIQIEKQGLVILDKGEFETKESSLIYIGTIGGIFMLGLFVGMIKKTRKVIILPPTTGL